MGEGLTEKVHLNWTLKVIRSGRADTEDRGLAQNSKELNLRKAFLSYSLLNDLPLQSSLLFLSPVSLTRPSFPLCPLRFATISLECSSP